MNEIKIMKEAFGFLAENGFAISAEKSSIEYCVTYFKSGKQIVLCYDLRQHRFDVGIRNVKCARNYGATYVPLLETDVGDTIQKEQLIEALNFLYHQAETDWTISREHFSEIVNAYAKFVKSNLTAILIYC